MNLGKTKVAIKSYYNYMTPVEFEEKKSHSEIVA